MKSINIINVTPDNILKEGLFCINDLKNPGFHNKRKWFQKRYAEGLRMKILKDSNSKMIGFIEYVPAVNAWRPVEATNFMFIHCMYVYPNSNKNKGYGSLLINEAEKEARESNMLGICVMTSKGSWMTDKRIFEKNNFKAVDQRGRFNLLSKKWDENGLNPKLLDWTLKQKKYKGWHLLYSDQCPWHEKSAEALCNVAMDFNINLQIEKIKTAYAARNAPSGFGVFNLLHNGKLLEDHYISATRFKNILKKELKIAKH